MPKRNLIPRKKTSVQLKLTSLEQVKMISEMLGKTQSDILNLALEAGIVALSASLDPKNAQLFTKINDLYGEEIDKVYGE